MKKSIFIVLTATLCLSFFASCGSDSGKGNEVSSHSPTSLPARGEVGSSWNSQAPQDFSAYVVFNADRTFNIYQKVETSTYRNYSGSYQLQDTSLSGVYSDNTPWGSSYKIEIDESGNTLKMTSSTSVSETSVYTRTTIPASVKADAKPMRFMRSEDFRLL